MAIGALTVNVQANTAKAVKGLNKFGKGAKKSGKSAKQAGKGVRSLSSAFMKMAAAAGAAVAAGASAKAFISIAESLDTIAKTSAKLGIMPGKLMALHHAATLSGVAIETMNKALRMQVRVISEAAVGTGPALKVIEEMGLSAAHLNKLDPSAQFKAIATAMERFPPQDKVRISALLFGGKGTDLINTLKMGADGLGKVENRLRRLGAAFTAEQLKKVEDFNDAMAELKLLTKTYGQRIVIEMSPHVTSGIKALAETVEGFALIFGGWSKLQEQNPWIDKGMRAAGAFWKKTPIGLAQGLIHKGSTAMAFQEDKSWRAFDDMLTDSLFGKGPAKRTQDFALEMDSWVSSIYNMRRVTPDELRRTREAGGGRTIRGLGGMTGEESQQMARRTIRALEGIRDLTAGQREDLRHANQVLRIGGLP